ncbi:protein of unknown function [Magnetospirillum sp. XM-1]|uniref:hypothetical protein n=1 Tax=Magnetospirillum sp. XM-1 TaxID=1663591 RepID=UPI00073DF0D3|nr:hypothetical protein [Magnetospirillum sp. XM-1]CUW39527.1 protein of unknown function [Magnetospirillum sp. XM-1]
MQELFLIPTLGRNAAMWLGRALNSHDDIKCTTGQVFGHDFPYSVFNEYSSNKMTFDFTQKLQRLYIDHFGPGKMLENSAGMTDKKFVGDIHGYDVGSLIKSIDLHGPLRSDIRLIGLVRHPVTWLNAWYSLYKNPQKTSQNLAHFQGYYIETGARAISRFPELNLNQDSEEVVVWVGVALIFFKIIIFEMFWYRAMRLPSFTIEGLFLDKAEMVRLFKEISGGKIAESSIDFAQIYGDESKSYGMFSGGKTSISTENAESVFASWPEGVGKVFSIMCDVMGGRHICDKFGYDMSFIDRSPQGIYGNFIESLRDILPPLVRSELDSESNGDTNIYVIAVDRAKSGTLNFNDLSVIVERVMELGVPAKALELCMLWIWNCSSRENKHLGLHLSAQCQIALHDLSAAEGSLREAIALCPDFASARLLLEECREKSAPL